MKNPAVLSAVFKEEGKVMEKIRLLNIRVLFLGIAFLLIGNVGLAADYTWNGSVDGDWFTPSNWSSPTGMDYPMSSTDTATIPAGVPNDPQITTDSSIFISNLTVQSGGFLTVANEFLYFHTDQATIGGTVTINDGTFEIGSSGGTVQSGGLLNLSGGALRFDSSSLGNSGTVDWSGGNVQPFSASTFSIINTGTWRVGGNTPKQLLGCTFTNESGGTLDISGILEIGISSVIDNSGTINWDGTLQSASPGSNFSFENDGQINVTGTSGNTLAYCSFSNLAGGVLHLASGTTLIYDGLQQNFSFNQSGEITGTGTLDISSISAGPPLSNQGIIAPGPPPGTLTLVGGFFNQDTGTIEIDITDIDTYDRFSVTGDVTLNEGDLIVHVSPAHTLNGGEVYSVLTATAGINGTFFVADFPFVSGYLLGPEEYNSTMTPTPLYSVDVPVTAVGPFTYTWTGSTSSEWNDSGNWSPSGVPDFGDTAIIEGGTPYDPVISASAGLGPLVQEGGTLTVAASGSLEVSQATISSAAELLLEGGSLIVAEGGTGSVTSGGIVRSAGGEIRLGPGADFDIEAEGVFSNTSATLVEASDATSEFLNHGLLQGNGTLTIQVADFINTGTIGPGLSPGILTIAVPGYAHESGNLAIEIEGTTPGIGHDQLQISGNTNLGGSLDVTLGAAYNPTDGDTFTILTVLQGMLFETFNTANLPSVPGYTWETQYTQSQVDLMLTAVPADTFTLGVNVLGGGQVSGSAISCPSFCSETYEAGTTVSLTATPDSGHQFDRWEIRQGSNPAYTQTGNLLSLVMEQDTEVTAVFGTMPQEQRSLMVSVSPEGSGDVSGNGITCPGDCTQVYDAGQTVSLTPSPADGFRFEHWELDGQVIDSESLSLSMETDHDVTAVFSEVLAALSVAVDPPDAGRVTGTGIDCPEDCTESVPSGTQLSLSAEPAEDWAFEAWTVNGRTVTDSPLQVTLDGETQVTARFRSSPPQPIDLCPDDPEKMEPGACGCGVPDTDRDADGVPDCNDPCPDNPNKVEPGVCGCDLPDADTDGDGIYDCQDGCPRDPNKTSPGECGCGLPDIDSDADGVLDCEDGCPNDPDKTAAGFCGCGNPDSDANENGVADCREGYSPGGDGLVEVLFEIPPGELRSQYRMRSFYIWPPREEWNCGDFLEDALDPAYLPNLFKIGTYDPRAGGYVECGSEMRIEPGRAYWFLAREGIDTIVEGYPVSMARDIEVKLLYNPDARIGWNMIAAPNDAVYDWNRMEVVAFDDQGRIIGPDGRPSGPSGIRPIAELPEENPFISKVLWQWRDGEYVYHAPDGESDDLSRFAFTPDPYLEPTQGYWVRTRRENVFLRFPVSARVSQPVARTAGEGRMAQRVSRFLGPESAVAASDAGPPMPMSDLNGDMAETDAGGGTSCFISTSGR